MWGQTLSTQNDGAYNATTNPYVVSSAEDWGKLASDVASGYSYDGEVIKLTGDITITYEYMVGDGNTYFGGTFDGYYNDKIYTLTLDYTDNGGYGLAPFFWTDGATIKNLKVAGSIDASYGGFAAGLIYSTSNDNGTTNVQNVTVSVNISAEGQNSCAGFAVYSAYLDFSNCVYNGRIVAGNNCGGFSASYYDSGNATFSNCIFNPAAGEYSLIITAMVGTQEHPFSGNFNGRIGNTYGAYTLTFNYGTAEEPTKDVIVAPFRYTNGATIQSLILHGAIYTNAGKEAGLIGVNTSTNSNYTTVAFVINYIDFYCYEDLWDAQGGGYAYDGSDVRFSYSSYEGLISASNYHGGSRDISSEVLPLLVTGGVGAWNDDQPATAPLGSGLLVLTALGAGYAAYKKRR